MGQDVQDYQDFLSHPVNPVNPVKELSGVGSERKSQMATRTKPPTLVVLQLTGGNDPLNTVVPYTNPLYYDSRPKVHVKAEDVLPIGDQYGFHPSMAAIKPFWDSGKMAIIAGTGYEDPSYSHF